MSPASVRFDAIPGIVPVLVDELTHRLPTARIVGHGDGHVDAVVDRLVDALTVRTAAAACSSRTFPVPRPKALLGDATFRLVLAQVADARALSRFTALRLGAAGADSAVFRRLAAALSGATGLPIDDADGDLLVRVVPAEPGWRVLVRLTPRPLSARTWRVPGFEGALDAGVAAAMVRLTRPRDDDVFLDPTCGSGTIVVERVLAGPAALVVGTDVDGTALAAARRNGSPALCRADGGRLPLPDGSVTAMCANPPWGHRMGSHGENERLYPALLAEAARVAGVGARFAVLTHDVRRFEHALRDQARWRVADRLRISLRGHHPRLYVLTDSRR